MADHDNPYQKKFLVVIDESPDCDRAVTFAAHRVKRTGGTVVLLSVIDSQDFTQFLGVEEVMRAEARDEAERLLDSKRARIGQIGEGVRTETVIRHIDYVADRVGPEHVGIGLDFVFRRGLDEYPPGFEASLWWPPQHSYVGRSNFVEPERMPAIAEGLVRLGYAESAIRGVLGENFLRVAEVTWLK